MDPGLRRDDEGGGRRDRAARGINVLINY